MKLMIDMPPEMVGRLHQAAARKGIAAADYARKLLEEQLLSAEQQEVLPFWATATREEWEQAFDAWVESHNHLPELPPEAFERASFYGERG